MGKSTVSYKLVDNQPDKFEVLNLDDYQKLKSDDELPRLEGMVNWDHPDIIRWNNIRNDIQALKNGKSVQINVWAHRSNPDYALHHKMKPRTIHPKPVLIVEGYLALYSEMDGVYDKSFYLDLNEVAREQRRLAAHADKDSIIGQGEYTEKVLKPMHKKYVEPTMKNADHVIDVSGLSADLVAEKIRELIQK